MHLKNHGTLGGCHKQEKVPQYNISENSQPESTGRGGGEKRLASRPMGATDETPVAKGEKAKKAANHAAGQLKKDVGRGINLYDKECNCVWSGRLEGGGEEARPYDRHKTRPSWFARL